VTNITSAPVSLPLIDGMLILTWNGSGYVYSSYDSNFGGWVDVACHFGHHIDLRAAERGSGSSNLTVEIDYLKNIHVCDMERPDPKARQCQQVDTAHTAHTGNGDPLGNGGAVVYLHNQQNLVDAVTVSIGGAVTVWNWDAGSSSWMKR